MSAAEKTTILKAIDIINSAGISGLGKCRACVSETGRNTVDIFTDDGYYCSVNVRSGRIAGV